MGPVQVKLFVQNLNPRLDYIASIILGDILGLNWEIVTDKEKLVGLPVINYSNENVAGSLNIVPNGLLSETGLIAREIAVSNWNEIPVFFQTGTGTGLPFDIFAASFWLITRYEEYLPHEKDMHGRFRASSSLAFRNGFLAKPVIDLWSEKFAFMLKERFPSLVIRKNKFRALLTVDIDVPFAYRGRNIFRNMGGFIRDAILQTGSIDERFSVLTGKNNDPYDVFDYITRMAEVYESEIRFFFSVGNYSGYDKNPSWKNRLYSDLIRNIALKYNAGLHPGYHAAVSINKLENEHKRLSIITGGEVASARFHYLRLFFPDSYRALIKAGIKEDYSLGFHDEPGFRAGISRPFNFYDLNEDKETLLRIVPFNVMDVTLSQYKGLGPSESGELIMNIMNEARRAGGLFVSLWHNTTLAQTPSGMEWRNVFESMLKAQQ